MTTLSVGRGAEPPLAERPSAPREPAVSAEVGSARVLIVDGDSAFLRCAAEHLRAAGWGVTESECGRKTIFLLEQRDFDLLVLDWMPPGCSGLEVLQYLRGRRVGTPVLMLTENDRLDQRLEALDRGADDCLVKPVALEEFAARCRALLRRTHHRLTLQLEGYLRLDPHARIAWRGDEQILLAPREAEILEYLLRHQNQIVTRALLARDVWRECHRHTSLNNVIDVQMMRLRRKLDGGQQPRLIHTVRGVGYRIVSPAASA